MVLPSKSLFSPAGPLHDRSKGELSPRQLSHRATLEAQGGSLGLLCLATLRGPGGSPDPVERAALASAQQRHKDAELREHQSKGQEECLHRSPFLYRAGLPDPHKL